MKSYTEHENVRADRLEEAKEIMSKGRRSEFPKVLNFKWDTEEFYELFCFLLKNCVTGSNDMPNVRDMCECATRERNLSLDPFLFHCTSIFGAKVLVEEYGCNVNYKYAQRNDITPIMAFAAGDELIDYYIARGAKLDIKDADGYSILFLALRSYNVSIDTFKRLIHAGADVLATDNEKKTLLIYACDVLYFSRRRRFWDFAPYLVDAGVPVNAVDCRGFTILLCLIDRRVGMDDLCFFVKDANADIEMQSAPLLHTPLMFAVGANNFTNLHALIALGADVNAVDKNGHTALDLAITGNKSMNIVSELIKHGGLFNISLHKEMHCGVNMLQYLYSYGIHFLEGLLEKLRKEALEIYLKDEPSELIQEKTNLEYGLDIPLLRLHLLPYHLVLDGLKMFKDVYGTKLNLEVEVFLRCEAEVKLVLRQLADIAQNAPFVQRRAEQHAQECERELKRHKN